MGLVFFNVQQITTFEDTLYGFSKEFLVPQIGELFPRFHKIDQLLFQFNFSFSMFYNISYRTLGY